MESAVNELADMLHMDPADLRLKNIVREGEVMPQYYNEKLNACALDRCLLRAMDMIGWRDKPLAVDLGDRVRAWAARSPCRLGHLQRGYRRHRHAPGRGWFHYHRHRRHR